MEGEAFAERVIDHFEEMLQQARREPLVMGIALHRIGWVSRIACGNCG